MRRFGRKIWIAVAAFAGISAAVPSPADTIIHKHTTYFSIGGRTAAELDREMLARGPLSQTTGRRHPGATRIRFTGTATFVGKKNRCHIGGAKVTLSTRIMLPRWSHRRKASKQLGLVWDTLSADIKRHEERHAEIARTHARAFEKQILSLPPASDCATLKARVNVLSREAMIAHEKDQMRFDRIEAINFERRMMRLLKHRLEAGKGQ